jgi:hypothetical protein
VVTNLHVSNISITNRVCFLIIYTATFDMGHVSVGRKYEMKMHVLGSSVPASVRPGQSSSLASEQDVSLHEAYDRSQSKEERRTKSREESAAVVGFGSWLGQGDEG